MENSQAVELSGIYRQMDAEGKKQLVKMAGKFLDVQKILNDEKSPPIDGNENLEVKNGL